MSTTTNFHNASKVEAKFSKGFSWLRITDAYGNDICLFVDERTAELMAEAFEEGQRQNEAAYERHMESLMESGGPDDSHYRQSMKDAGRGHLLGG